MSFKTPSTPSVTRSPEATSPKYNMSGIANEVNAMRNRRGYLSTFFGRSSTGTANAYNMRRDNNMLNSYFSQLKKQ